MSVAAAQALIQRQPIDLTTSVTNVRLASPARPVTAALAPKTIGILIVAPLPVARDYRIAR
jgi:hypothetical protein